MILALFSVNYVGKERTATEIEEVVGMEEIETEETGTEETGIGRTLIPMEVQSGIQPKNGSSIAMREEKSHNQIDPNGKKPQRDGGSIIKDSIERTATALIHIHHYIMARNSWRPERKGTIGSRTAQVIHTTGPNKIQFDNAMYEMLV